MEEYLTNGMKETQFYKIMFEMYDKLLDKGKYHRFFKGRNKKERIKAIDNIINEYLSNQWEEIMSNVPTVVFLADTKGLITNKDKEFSNEGVYERNCLYKQ